MPSWNAVECNAMQCSGTHHSLKLIQTPPRRPKLGSSGKDRQHVRTVHAAPRAYVFVCFTPHRSCSPTHPLLLGRPRPRAPSRANNGRPERAHSAAASAVQRSRIRRECTAVQRSGSTGTYMLAWEREGLLTIWTFAAVADPAVMGATRDFGSSRGASLLRALSLCFKQRLCWSPPRHCLASFCSSSASSPAFASPFPLAASLRALVRRDDGRPRSPGCPPAGKRVCAR